MFVFFKKKKLTVLFLCAFGLQTGDLYSQTRSQVTGSDLDKQTMTLFLQSDVAANTYESESVGSKETASLTSFAVGSYAGEARKLGFLMRSSDIEVPFTLNNGKMTQRNQELYLQYRFGYVYPTIGGTLNQVKVESGAERVVDFYATGIGAGVSLYVPIWQKAVAFGEVMQYQPASTFNRGSLDNVKMLSRTHTDVGLSFDVTQRMVDLLVGYRAKTHNLEIDGEVKEEKASGVYGGVRLGVYF